MTLLTRVTNAVGSERLRRLLVVVVVGRTVVLEELLLEVVEAILTAAWFTVLVTRVVVVVTVVELRVEVVVTGQVTVTGLPAAWPLRISLCQVS